MASKNYAELDEEDFYGQGFEQEGVVSVWLGLTEGSGSNEDVLQDLCGVGYYDLDSQEGNSFGFELVPVHRLLEELSYAITFSEQVCVAAKKLGLEQARWVIVQYDFAYERARVKRPVAPDPVFIGVFPYRTE